MIRRHGNDARIALFARWRSLVITALGVVALFVILPGARADSGASTTDRVAPSSPGPIVVKGVTQTAVTISWLPAIDDVAVTGYGLLWNSRRPKDVEKTVLPTFTKHGLSCGTSYTVSVVAFDAVGNHSADPAMAVVSTGACLDTSPPSAPTGLTQVAQTATSATLSWEPSSDDVGVAGYVLSRSGVPVGSTSGTSYTVGGLTCGSGYTAVVQAFDAAGNRSAPTSFTGTAAPCADRTPPSPPSNLAQTARTDTSMTITWSPSTDASGVTGYGIYVDGALVSRTSTTSATVSSLACGKTYSVGVDAVDAAGNRSSATSAQMPTAACPPTGGGSDTSPPTAPQRLRVTSLSLGSISLAWNPSTDNVAVTGYSVYSGSTWVGDTPGTTFLVPSATCGSTMSVGVEARDAARNRSPRTTITVATHPCSDTTPPSAPGAPTLQNTTEASLTVTWAPSTDASGIAGYGMYLNGTRTAIVTSTQYTFSGLVCGKTYTLGVDAVDGAGNRSQQSSTMLSTATCSDTVAPTKPTGLKVADVTATTLSFSWLPSTDAVGVKGYDVYVGSLRAATTTSTSVALGLLACGTTVVLGVEAFDASGNRSQRATLNATLSACGGKISGDLYVAPTGSDSGSCALSAPCASLGRAYEAATPGQRIVVASGSYPGQTIAYDPDKESSSARVAIVADGATFSSLTIDGVQHLALEGMIVTGRLWLRTSTQSSITADSRPALDIEISRATLSHFTFRNVAYVTLRDSSVGGYDVSTTGWDVPKVGAYAPDAGGAPLVSRGVVIERVRFHDVIRTEVGSSHAECLYLDGGIDGLVVRQSTFTNCGVFNVFGQSNGGDNANITLENNVFDVPRDTGGSAAGSALNFKDGAGAYRNLVIRFNSIVGNIRADSGSYSGVSIVGNALANTACASLFPASAYDRNVATIGCGSTDVQADPQFVSASRASCNLTSCLANDLRLRSTSPAIDALTSGPAIDNDGTSRPRGAGFDAGSDEAA